MEKPKVDILSFPKNFRDPLAFALPLVEEYLIQGRKEGFNMDEDSTFTTTIALSSILANWRELVKSNPEALNGYLNNVIEIIKSTKEKNYKNVLSVPIMCVFDKISEVEEGKGLCEKIFEEVEELCNKDIELTRLSRFICSGGKYQEFNEVLDM